MAQFMLTIVYDPSKAPDGVPSRQKLHAALGEEMRAKGHYLGGAGLAPVEMYAKRVMTEGEDSPIVDGPFAETREALGGYFMVECSEEDALNWARRIAHDDRSWIEVRRMWMDPHGA